MRTYIRSRNVKQAAGLVALVMLLVAVPGGCPNVNPTDEAGREVPTVNVPPVLQFVGPAANVSTYGGQAIPINWYDTDPDDDALIQLYYDKDGLKGTGDEVLLTATYENPDGAGDSYAWALGNLLPDTYHLLAVIDDGTNTPGTVYLPSTITVQSSGPVLAITEPAGPLTRKPSESVMLQWSYEIPVKPATVTLFYDTDRNKANGISGEIIAVAAPTGTGSSAHTWQLSGLPAGQYYLGATLNDQEHPAVTVYAPGAVAVSGPALLVDSPAGSLSLHGAGTVPVKWRSDKVGLDAAVRIFCDLDGIPDSGDEVILKSLQEPASQVSNLQQVLVPALPPDSYHVGVELNDGRNPALVAYAAGRLNLIGPGLTVTHPAAPLSAKFGDAVSVRWLGQTGGAKVKVTIFSDDDRNYDNGTVSLIDTFDDVPDPVGNAASWTIPALAAKTYYIGARMDDGVSPPVVAYAPGQIDIGGPTLTFTEPTTGVNVLGGDLMPIGWQVQPANASVTVTFFYDDDLNYANGTLGQVLQKSGPSTAAGDTGAWTVPALAMGRYYICGKLEDGLNPTELVYAPGDFMVGSPALTLTAPTGAVSALRGGTTPIRWQAQAGGTNVTVTIFYDIDQNFGNGTLGQLPPWTGTPAAAGDSTIWQIPKTLLARSYYIAGQLEDGINPPVVAYAPGQIDLSPSSLTLLQPGATLNIARGDSIPVQWLADTAGATATVTIFYDNDTNSANGTLGQIAQRIGAPTPAGDAAVWTVPALPAGTYYIGGTLVEGLNSPVVTYASGQLIVPAPQATVLQPTGPLQTLLASVTIPISWSITQVQSTTGTVELFYDTDRNKANGIAGTIAILPFPAGNNLDWNVPLTLGGGPWYIGLTINDGLNPPVTAYSSGTVRVLNQAFFTRQLELAEAMPLPFGRTFRGLSPDGQLGAVAAQVPWSRLKADPKDPKKLRQMRQPGIRINSGDNNDDFVLVAPKANPFYLERPNAGEAYLIHSDPLSLFDLSVNAEPILVSRTGSSTLHGAIFSGAAHTGQTDGIRAVTISRDVDNDNIPDLLFGLPWIDKIQQEEQVYDPWDTKLDVFNVLTYTNLLGATVPVPNAATGPAAYADDYRKGAGSSEDYISAGFVVAVAGSNAPIRGTNPKSVIGLDHVGQINTDVHPLIYDRPTGLRMYSPAPFQGNFAQGNTNLKYPQATIGSPTDKSLFGEEMIEADIDGDGRPEWVFTQPASVTDDKDFSHGQIHIMWPQLSKIWAQNVATLNLDPGSNSCGVTVTKREANVTTTQGQATDANGVQITATITTFTILTNKWVYSGTQVVQTTRIETLITTADAMGNVIGVPQLTITNNTATFNASTIPALIAFPKIVNPAGMVFSWPYAVAVGDYELSIDGSLVLPVNDERSREYHYPVFFDCLGGYNDAAHGGNPAEVLGHLRGLANAGDFNGDTREDITLGAPEANPDGKVGAGCAFLVFGKSNFGDHSLSSVGLTDGSALAGIKIKGATAGDQVGTSQASAGDFNGDGIGDWVIGLPGYNGNAGAAAIIYGTTGRQGVYKVSDIGTATLPGVILAGGAANDRAGTCVAGVGDVDNDGFDDVAIVSPGAKWTLADGTTRTASGVVYLIYGAATYTGASGTRDLAKTAQSSLPGKAYVGVVGRGTSQVMTVAPAGDVDNDGNADFLIGNPNYDILDGKGQLVLPQLGEVYLVRGSDRMLP